MKVRPNGIPRGADLDATFRQIGRALHEVGEDAAGFGVEIRVEVHGAVTQEVPNFAKIMAYADHPNVFVCWNSNPTDVVDGSIRENFALVAPKIREVHLRDLSDETYPWRELFALLSTHGYQGYTLAEIPESPDPERVLRYFRALWLAYQPDVRTRHESLPPGGHRGATRRTRSKGANRRKRIIQVMTERRKAPGSGASSSQASSSSSSSTPEDHDCPSRMRASARSGWGTCNFTPPVAT